MFSNAIQPSIISLFSSASSAPLQLFQVHTDSDPEICADSIVCFMKDCDAGITGGRSILPPTPGSTDLDEVRDTKLIKPALLCNVDDTEHEDVDDTGRDLDRDPRWRGGNDRDSGKQGKNKKGYELNQTILQLQSPTIRTTFIRCPPSSSNSPDLGITLSWLHIQVRPLGPGIGSGRDAWAFDVGVIDRSGKRGVIRASTFQKEAALRLGHGTPLIHIPLHMPPRSPSSLTSWATVDLDVAATMRYFNVFAISRQTLDHDSKDYERHAGQYGAASLGAFSSITFIKVYANCRLRRIWFSENKHSSNLPWEFQLYAA